jgi:peptide/nickel transport system ATP-binding protein/oligopeptide transport system ATP-binding protein
VGNLIFLNEIKKYFPYGGGIRRKDKWLRAVDGVSFDIKAQEILGLVGESGCGKTTLGRILIGILPATSGYVRFEDKRLDRVDKKTLNRVYRKMNIVFQDPYASLNPKWNIYTIIKEPLGDFPSRNEEDLEKKIVTLLNNVGISREAVFRYPHEFSGGQRQRIAIARALVMNPSFVILDEPTSNLDVSVQAQILNLLMDLKELYKITYLFISHNLGVIRFISDRIVVMYFGKVVEMARKDDLFTKPFHPYTNVLLSAVPQIETERKEVRTTTDSIEYRSQRIREQGGCIFYDRCLEKTEICRKKEPRLYGVAEEHFVRCFLFDNK